MNAKELERLLAHLGANPSAVDVVTRKLRDAFKVSTGGRGINAHRLSVDEVAWIVLTYAGSEIAAKAAETLARLLDLITNEPAPAPNVPWSNDFVASFQLILRDEIQGVREVRVCRNVGIAEIIFDDGTVRKFVASNLAVNDAAAAGQAMFRSEGVLSGGLIEALKHRLAADIGPESDD